MLKCRLLKFLPAFYVPISIISWSAEKSENKPCPWNVNFNRYHIYPKNSDREAWANSADPDQTPQNAASDLDLHCLPLNPQLWT